MPGSYTYKFSKILKKYNLPKELTVHSLRHTNASLLIAQNVDIRTVANLLGHAQPSTTLNIYAHAFDSTKRVASERLKKILKF
jgi:integrase